MTGPSTSIPLRVAIVMTVFNRRDATLRCIRSIAEQDQSVAQITVYVVDDASTDGTSQAIAGEFPDVKLLSGSGQLFWNGGMSLGLDAAYAVGYDFYWWLNDDVELDPDAFQRLLRASESIESRGDPLGIVVGSLRDPDDGQPTYGGVSRLDPRRKVAFNLVDPGDEPVPVETMNGNCVLVPGSVADVVGNLTPEYIQKMGDYDYGLRARRAGFENWVAPGSFGVCARHPMAESEGGSFADEIRLMWSTKELPFEAWKLFCQRWSGPMWPIYFASPYARRGFAIVKRRFSS